MYERNVERLAELIVAQGANVQPSQIVFVNSETGKEQLTRAVAESAYRRGAKFVDVWYFDPYVKRARIANAAEETLDFVPSWYGQRMRALGEQRCARISLSGPGAPGVLDDLDPVRLGRDQLPFLDELLDVINARTTNWTGAPCPTEPWARLVHPDLDGEQALARLWQEIDHVCRLDEEDPGAAWRARMEELEQAAVRLTERRFDALRFRGPGTDLTVGLLPASGWASAMFSTADGLPHMPNLPTEEVFTTPDPARTEGLVRSTKPLLLADGSSIRGLSVRFEGGRAVEIDAEAGAETMRTRAARDDGASRLGEVALVDGRGRIGPLGTVFYDTLLDENSASHIALGDGFEFLVEGEEKQRVNHSSIHVDFMIGGPDVGVTGVTPEGEEIPVLVEGAWQI